MDDVLLGAIIGGAFAALIVGLAIEGRWQERTVDRGLALYCPLNGEWAWKGECPDE